MTADTSASSIPTARCSTPAQAHPRRHPHATYTAELILARLLRLHFAKADDDARTLLGEILSRSADLEIVGRQLHVRMDALSALRRSRARAGLCAELTETETETTYPGADLVPVYTCLQRQGLVSLASTFGVYREVWSPEVRARAVLPRVGSPVQDSESM